MSMRYRSVCHLCGASHDPGQRCDFEDNSPPDEEIRASCSRPIRRASIRNEYYEPDAYVARPGREIVL